ncbi:MAG: toxin C-terminal domain-containing protein [Clostridia bacterium]|nr:toxin C-terminal domain-containing protein [Clostridia bacterium]
MSSYGRVSSHKDAANKTDSYSYDALDRISQITYNGNTLKYYYGSNGKLAQATDSIADTRTKYVYDFAGRLVSERTYTGTALDVSNLQSALDYTYTNGTNQLSAIKTKSTLGTNTLGITYGDLTDAKSAGYIYSESWNGAVAKRYTYDDFGRIASNRTQTTATSLNTIYTYKNLTAWRTTPLVESLQTPAATYTYTYDNNGNILSESDGLYTTSYEYYANNMLERENNQRAGYTRTYTYVDANISTVKTYAYTTGALGTALSTNVYAYDPNCMDLLTSARGKNIYYTGVMPNTYDGHAITWARSGLMSAYDSGTDSHSYTYDVSGRRLEKEDNGVTTEFIYAGDLLLGQKTGSNSFVFKFDSNGDYFGFTYNGTPYYYVKNLQGDVVAIANNAGTIVARYYYDAWGKLLSYTDTSGANIATINPIRYRSYYYDTETGFYFLQSRYYDPEIGRFISADEIVSDVGSDLRGYNLFAYCFNNPVNLNDDSGEWPSWATKVLIGTAVIGVAAVLTVATAGTGTALACFALGALKGAISGALIGAASGAVTGAVGSRITTGSWEGAGQAALDGAASGYMSGAISGFIMGGLSSSVCFVAGTVVLTVFGKVAIETICVGDYVYATDPETGETALKKVLQTFVNEADELVHVYVNSDEIICTNEHPFYVPQKGWTAACELRAGDILVSVNGKYVVVEQVQHEILENPVKVYNFEVEGFHTYFVGKNSLIVHNLCEADEVAKQLGYKKVNGQYSHGQTIYHSSKASKALKFISRDVDSHSGGYWKAASSIKKLASKTLRSGTYTKFLEWIAK